MNKMPKTKRPKLDPTPTETRVECPKMEIPGCSTSGTTKDKNDNISFVGLNNYCRTCVDVIDDNQCYDLHLAKTYIDALIPKLNYNLTKEPVVCNKCYQLLESFYQFRLMFMNVENDLENYCSLQQIPIDIEQFISNTLSQDNNKIKVEDSTFEMDDKKVDEKLSECSIKTEMCSELEFLCNDCKLPFKSKNSLNEHRKCHFPSASVKKFSCDCGKAFNRKARLKKHQEIHVKKDKPFVCVSCGKRFSEQDQLDCHEERVHINEKPFACELCGNKYTNKPGLDVHVKSHSPNKKPKAIPDLMCDICGKLFFRKYSLEKHRMSHTGDKPHECTECNMKFKERYQLTIHMRRHTGEKPFKCEVCSFKFSCKNRLSVHMRIHTGARPFPCNFCDMAFTRNDHLIKHIRAIHTGERPFECSICSKTFNRKDYLLKHQKNHFKCI